MEIEAGWQALDDRRRGCEKAPVAQTAGSKIFICLHIDQSVNKKIPILFLFLFLKSGLSFSNTLSQIFGVNFE